MLQMFGLQTAPAKTIFHDCNHKKQFLSLKNLIISTLKNAW